MSGSEKHPIHIVAIGGSVRPGNLTAKAMAIAVDEIQTSHQQISVHVIDPARIELPLPGLAPSTGPSSQALEQLRQTVATATGVLLATPEYHGSYSSVIKLVIDNLGFPSVLSGKAVALLGVAAGQIGAVKALEHLRSVCSHVGAIVLPGPVSIAGASRLFDDQGHCVDPAIEKRIRGMSTRLIDYIHNHICPKAALEQMVRGQTDPNHEGPSQNRPGASGSRR